MFSTKVLNSICSGLNLDIETLTKGLATGEAEVSAQRVSLDLRAILLRDNKFCQGESFDSDLIDSKHSLTCEHQVRLIANAILFSAKNCLPEYFAWPHDSSSPIRKRLSVSEVVSKWSRGNSGAKLEIGRMLARAFHPLELPDGSSKSYKDGLDSFDQPMERVLPGCYGKWKPEMGAANRPNCLGKFQLLVALGDILQCRMLAVTPLVYTTSKVNEYRSNACKIIIETYQKSGLTINEKKLSSLAGVISHSRLRGALPPLQHFAVLYETGDGLWLLIDPNSGLASLVEDSEQMNLAWNRLSEVESISPGASIIHRNTYLETDLKKQLELVKEASEKVVSIASRYVEFDNWQCLRNFLMDEGLHDSFNEWDEFIDLNARNPKDRFDQISVRLWNEANPDLKVDNLSSLNTDISQLAETILYRFLKRGEDEMRFLFQSNMLMGRAQHPLSEISLAPFRMATATISHVAYDISEEVGFETEKLLFSFGLNEGQLYNIALGAFPKSPTSCEHAQKAYRILSSQQFVGDLVRRFLKGMEDEN